MAQGAQRLGGIEQAITRYNQERKTEDRMNGESVRLFVVIVQKTHRSVKYGGKGWTISGLHTFDSQVLQLKQ